MVLHGMDRPLFGLCDGLTLLTTVALVVGILGQFRHIIASCSGVVQYHAVGHDAETGGIGGFLFIYQFQILACLLLVAFEQPSMRQREE